MPYAASGRSGTEDMGEMRRALRVAAILAAAATTTAVAPVPPPVSPAVPPAADPAIAVQRQLDAALAAGTSAALILFLARYPDGPAAEGARAALAVRRAPDPAPAAGATPADPDRDIAAAFDRARLAGPAALDAFAARTGNHPLGAEARRWSRWLRAGGDTRESR